MQFVHYHWSCVSVVSKSGQTQASSRTPEPCAPEMTDTRGQLVDTQHRLVIAALALIVVAALACVFRIVLTPAASFSLQVFPEQFKSDVIPGQRCVFLIYVTDDGEGRGRGDAVSVSATAPGCTVTVNPQSIAPGRVAEVTVIPSEATIDSTVNVTIRTEREGLVRTKSVALGVFDEEDTLGEEAAIMLDKFISWLEAKHPELGISAQTEWTGTIVTPRWLVVSHYLFFSDEWELHIEWHIMIAPYDWARIDLRRRFSESAPSSAFEISSVSANTEPHSIDPPE